MIPPFPGSVDNFYPRSPCGERLNGDAQSSCFDNFYPRSPCGERHKLHINRTAKAVSISIHALLAESDVTTPAGAGSARDFYPRSPCGERLGESNLDSYY